MRKIREDSYQSLIQSSFFKKTDFRIVVERVMIANSISKVTLKLKNTGMVPLKMPFEIERDDTEEEFEVRDFNNQEQTFEVQIPMKGLPDQKCKLPFIAVKNNEILTKFEWECDPKKF